MNPEHHTSAPVKTNSSPALARVSNQLALTAKLLAKPEEPFLIPYRKGNKWGFCDRNKNIIIDCIYDEAKPFGVSLRKSFDSNYDSCLVDPFGREINYHTEADSFYKRFAGVKLNGKYGFINKLGVEVIPPKYDYNGYFYKNLAVVSSNRKYGYVNGFGLEVIPLKYDYANDFRDSIAKVRLNEKNGFINQTGAEVIPIIYDEVNQYVGNCLVSVKIGSKWGLITQSGQNITNIKYDHIDFFKMGVARVQLDGMCGFIDTNGREITPIKYQFNPIKEFSNPISYEYYSEGLFIVKLNNKYGFINLSGQEIIAPKYDYMRTFSEGLALIRVNGKYGFVDRLGVEIIPPQYALAEPFSEGLALVGLKSQFLKTGYIQSEDEYLFADNLLRVKPHGFVGYINKTGNEVIPMVYEAAESFQLERAEVVLNGRSIIIDRQGQIIEEQKKQFIYEEVEKRIKSLVEKILSKRGEYVYDYEHDDEFVDGLLWMKIDDKWCVVNEQGDEVIPLRYNWIGYFHDDLAVVGLHDEKGLGYIDRCGNIMIQFKYDEAGDFYGGFAEVSRNGLKGIVSKSGKEIIPLNYTRIYPSVDGLAYVEIDNKGGYIDQNGIKYWED